MFVADEIQMGFYRAGKFWAIENFHVDPDIVGAWYFRLLRSKGAPASPINAANPGKAREKPESETMIASWF